MIISGNGFLYNMVRIIAGTLWEIAIGKIKCRGFAGNPKILRKRKAGKTAPAQGLYLEKVAEFESEATFPGVFSKTLDIIKYSGYDYVWYF